MGPNQTELGRRVEKVGKYHLWLFLLPLLSLLVYGWWQAPTLNQRADNPQRFSPLEQRGRILDRHGAPLAVSREGERRYPLGPATGPLIGYQLRGRNRSGLEALMRDRLSPPPPPKSLWGARDMDRSSESDRDPLVGPDLTLSIDAQLQRKLYQAFLPRVGAVAVADLNSGEVLAAVSAPSFEPEEIARHFGRLMADPQSPLIERVGSGLYPVRGAEGAPLIPEGQRTTHSWLKDSPFPGFPAASSALNLEGTLLVTPLMLLQYASGQAGDGAAAQPTLFPLAEGVKPALSQLSLSPARATTWGQMSVWVLEGPPFRESPPFEVVVGKSDSKVWVVVVESKTSETLAELERDIFPLLDEL